LPINYQFYLIQLTLLGGDSLQQFPIFIG
jgi:hypothetical protein